MPIIKQTNGHVDYEVAGQPAKSSSAVCLASNRQKKMLRFFGVFFTAKLTMGAAGWEIATTMMDAANRDRWRRYLFLTKDFDSETDALKPFDEAALQSVSIPEGWSSSESFRSFQDELVDKILHDESPFDVPQPQVLFSERSFIFTGKFNFGTRKACQDAVVLRGGKAPDLKSVSHSIHYLVIGTEGSKAWRRGNYGNKIEDAILARREYGSPAIVSEEHWVTAMNAK